MPAGRSQSARSTGYVIKSGSAVDKIPVPAMMPEDEYCGEGEDEEGEDDSD